MLRRWIQRIGRRNRLCLLSGLTHGRLEANDEALLAWRLIGPVYLKTKRAACGHWTTFLQIRKHFELHYLTHSVSQPPVSAVFSFLIFIWKSGQLMELNAGIRQWYLLQSQPNEKGIPHMITWTLEDGGYILVKRSRLVTPALASEKQRCTAHSEVSFNEVKQLSRFIML